MVVAVGSSAFFAAVAVAVAGLFGHSGSLIGDVLGLGGSKGRIQFTGSGDGYGDTDATASGADTNVGAAKSGDVDQSWAFLPVAVSCVANCPAVECSCPSVECTCTCDTPEPKAWNVEGPVGWRGLFVEPVVLFSWLGIGMLSGFLGRCSVQRQRTFSATPPSLLQLGSHHAGDMPSPSRSRSEALRALPRRGRVA